MGNQHSENEEGYIEDQRFGLIKIQNNLRQSQTQQEYSEQQDEVILLKSNDLSVSEYQKWKKKLQSYKQLREILFLPIHTKIGNKSFCGNSCTLQLRYPMYRILLREEIENRYKIDKFYQQTQIWYLLYNLVALGKNFQKLGHKIGDVHPKNIVINEKGLMKIIGQISMPKEQDNFTKICDSQINDVFLAPEQIDYYCLQNYKYPPGANPNSAELFSIGMTILEAGTLELSTYVYDKGPYKINFQKLRNNIEIFKVHYSQNLCSIVEALLSYKPSSRRSCKDIYNNLRPYENQILSLEPFTWQNYKNNHSRYKNGDSLVYSSANSQVNNSSIIIPQNLIQTKGTHTNIFTDSRHPNGHSPFLKYQPNSQIPTMARLNSDSSMKRLDNYVSYSNINQNKR